MWRLAHDRVLVRDTRSGDGAELIGAAAAAWLALDAPASSAEVRAAIGPSDAALVDDAITGLLAGGWLIEVEP